MSEEANIEVDEQHSSAKLSIAKQVYSKQAILRTCYWMERNLWFQVDQSPDRWLITVGLRTTIPTLDQPKLKKIDAYLPEVFSSLLDSQLRVEIQTETAPIRELILAKAFAESGVLEDCPPGTFQDPVESSKATQGSLVTISNKIVG